MTAKSRTLLVVCALFSTGALAGPPTLDLEETGYSAAAAREAQQPTFGVRLSVEPMLGGVVGQVGGMLAVAAIVSTVGAPVALPVMALALAAGATVGAFTGTLAGWSFTDIRVEPNQVLLGALVGGALMFGTIITGMPLGLLESSLPFVTSQLTLAVADYQSRMTGPGGGMDAKALGKATATRILPRGRELAGALASL